MSGCSNFDVIAQALLMQKQVMEQLEEENRELRRQLSDLHEGRGIFVEICGRRFALQVDQVSAPVTKTTIPLTSATSEPVPLPPVPQPVTSIPQAVPSESPDFPLTDEISSLPDIDEPPTPSLPETAHATTELFDDEEAHPITATFLEEMMLDEFASAATGPMAVWPGPVKKQEAIDEEEKAALRRELIGSFLLE